MPKRDGLAVLEGFLKAVKKGYNGTFELIKESGVGSSRQLKIYKDLALEKKFIKEEGWKYEITEKGVEFITRYHQAMEFLK